MELLLKSKKNWMIFRFTIYYVISLQMDADWTIPFVVIQRGDGIGFKRLSFESILFRIKSG